MLVETYLVYAPKQSSAIMVAVAKFLASNQFFVWEESKKRFDDTARLVHHCFEYHDLAEKGKICDSQIWFSLLFNLPRLDDDLSREITCQALIPISDASKRIRSSVQINDALLRITVLKFFDSGLTRTSEVYEIRPQT